MPGALVVCTSSGGEDLSFSAFADEASKATFVEAKAELICGRALAPERDGTSTTQFEGIIYVDAGTVIIEPDSTEVRNQLPTDLGATPSKMCADAVGDTVPPTGGQ